MIAATLRCQCACSHHADSPIAVKSTTAMKPTDAATLSDEHRPAGLRRIDLLASQEEVQKQGVQAGAQADRQREPGVPERADEGEVHRLRRDSVAMPIFTGVTMFCLA